jgi:sulfide:quinone oxidoreductase
MAWSPMSHLTPPSPRVVVLGGGVAALETALLVQSRLSGRVDLRVVSEHDDFVLRENLVYVPFGGDPADATLSVAELLARAGIASERGHVEGVDPDTGRVHVTGGREIPYEHLVIATGAASGPDAVPGVAEHAVDVSDAAGMLELRERIARLRGQAREGTRRRVLFAVQAHDRRIVPLYEVALMLDTWTRREHAREHVEIAFVTHETSFLEACGPRMHDIVDREFAKRRIEAQPSERVVAVRAHEAAFAGGRTERFDLLVTIPPQRPAVSYDGLPVDEHGFLRVAAATRQVLGRPEIYVPGEASDFPLDSLFLALLQADAVADHLTATVTGGHFERPFDAVSIHIVEMLDRAAFARVPLEVTADPDHPVRPRSDAQTEYKIGVSPAWRAARRTLTSHLLMRFAAGEPFRAGPERRLQDAAVRAMAGMLAD